MSPAGLKKRNERSAISDQLFPVGEAIAKQSGQA
jgi:hypothetical protein